MAAVAVGILAVVDLDIVPAVGVFVTVRARALVVMIVPRSGVAALTSDIPHASLNQFRFEQFPILIMAVLASARLMVKIASDPVLGIGMAIAAIAIIMGNPDRFL